MIDWPLIFSILRTCNHPAIPNLRDEREESLFPASLVLGNVALGRQSAGKSTSLARHRVEYDITHPKDGSLSIDRSGSYTDEYLKIAYSLYPEHWPALKKKIRYIRLGDPNWSVPLPAFSPLYGNPMEEQVQRMTNVFIRLLDELEKKAPVAGAPTVKAYIPHTSRLAVAMALVRPMKEPLQTTEIPYLMEDPKLLRVALSKVKDVLNPLSVSFFQNRVLGVRDSEREFRSYSATPIFADLGVDGAIAHLGAHRPTFTFKEGFDKGLIILVDGSLALDQSYIDLLCVHIYCLFKEQLVKRTPNAAPNKMALIVDEVRSLLKIPSMAREMAEFSQLWRARGSPLYIVIQSLSLLDEELRRSIWGLANIWCFGLLDKNDAAEVAYQVTRYNPVGIKQTARTESQNNVTEPERGQDRLVADWIANLGEREMIMRRFVSERQPDVFVRHVRRTKDVRYSITDEQLEDLKVELLKEYAVPTNEVYGAVWQRLQELQTAEPKETTAPKINKG